MPCHNMKAMNWKIITWFIGVSLLLVAALMTVSGVIALCTPGDESRFPLILKGTGIIEMLTGRLEFFPILYLFQSVRKQ